MLARSNPYRSECVLRLPYLPPEGDVEGLIVRLLAQKGRGAILGPEGSGKTTLLEQLGPLLEKRGYRVQPVGLSLERRLLPPAFWDVRPGKGDAILLDGAEVLSAWNWRRLLFHCRHAGILLATVHRPCSLKTLCRTSTSPHLLRELTRQLGQEVPLHHCETLWQGHNGNLRLALRTLYDECSASRQESGPL